MIINFIQREMIKIEILTCKNAIKRSFYIEYSTKKKEGSIDQ